MITFWINEFKHFYGLRPNASFKFESENGCPSYFHELFLLYGLKFKVKSIRKDKPNPNECNICLIPAQGKPNANYKLGQITGAALDAKDDILWCYDNDIKVIIDRSREQSPWNIYEMIDYLNAEGLISWSNFRILIGHNGPKEYLCKNPNPLYDKLIINSCFFLYEFGGLAHNYINHKKIHELNISQAYFSTDKKYTFTSLFGEMRKPQRLILGKELYHNSLLDNAFWTSLKRYSDDLIEANFKSDIDKFISQYGIDVYNFLTKERQFDSGKIDNASDRITPNQCYESHFYIGIESSYKHYFFTEKSYKPLALGMPFIIYGNPQYNDVFFRYHGIEKYDELFDYGSIERDVVIHDVGDFNYLNSHAKRLCSGMKEAFNVKIYNNTLYDKCKHNREIFLKQTTKDKFIEFVYEVFESW